MKFQRAIDDLKALVASEHAAPEFLSMQESASNAIVLLAFHGAMAEFRHAPSRDHDDAIYAGITAAAVAHDNLAKAFPAPVAKELAAALARAARIAVWGDE